MDEKWKDDVYRKRAELAQHLHEPMARLAGQCVPALGDRQLGWVGDVHNAGHSLPPVGGTGNALPRRARPPQLLVLPELSEDPSGWVSSSGAVDGGTWPGSPGGRKPPSGPGRMRSG